MYYLFITLLVTVLTACSQEPGPRLNLEASGAGGIARITFDGRAGMITGILVNENVKSYPITKVTQVGQASFVVDFIWEGNPYKLDLHVAGGYAACEQCSIYFGGLNSWTVVRSNTNSKG